MQYCYTMPIETLKENEVIDEIIGTQTPHLVIFEQNTNKDNVTNNSDNSINNNAKSNNKNNKASLQLYYNKSLIITSAIYL